MKETRESKIESGLKARIKKMGGRYYKFVSPQNNGVPDRIVVYNGLVVFVELKRPKEEPRPLQKHVIRDMRRAGAIVAVINDFEKIDAFAAWLTENAPKTPPEAPDVPQAGFYPL